MKLKLDPGLLAKFPGASITFVVARLPDSFSDEHHAYIRKIRGELRNQIEAPPLSLSKASYRVNSLNVKRWREVYTATGVKPKTYPPSVDALTGRVLKDGIWNPISPTVDAYNCTSVLHQYPMGAYDLATITGDITVRLTSGGETFFPLGQVQKSGELVSRFDTEEGQVVYADEEKVLCWSWNYRDCGVTPISGDTRYGIYFIDCPGDSPYSSPQDALRTLIGHFDAIGCRVLGSGVVNGERNECEIPLEVELVDLPAFEEKKRVSQNALERLQGGQAPEVPALAVDIGDGGPKLFDRRNVDPVLRQRVHQEQIAKFAFAPQGSGSPSDSQQALTGNDSALLFANLDVVIAPKVRDLLLSKISADRSPFHFASQSGDVDLLKRLERFLPIDDAGVDREGLVGCAASSEMAEYLGKQGSILSTGDDPVFVALAGSDMVQLNRLFAIHGAEDLRAHFDALRSQDSYGCDAWHYAALNHMTLLMNLLRDIGLPCTNVAKTGQTPCHVATSNVDVLRALLDCRSDDDSLDVKGVSVDINTPDSNGWTPLMYAKVMGHEASVALLLEQPDVDKEAVDQYGRTYETVSLHAPGSGPAH